MPTKKKAIAKKVAAPKAKNSHKGLMAAGLIAGAALGVATAYYLKTPKGKKMLQQAEKKAMELQKKLMKELDTTKKLTKERYSEVVEKIMAYYVKTKDITQAEVPEIKSYLMDKWKQIEKEYKSV
jgi:uncharacterized protein HemX